MCTLNEFVDYLFEKNYVNKVNVYHDGTLLMTFRCVEHIVYSTSSLEPYGFFQIKALKHYKQTNHMTVWI